MMMTFFKHLIALFLMVLIGQSVLMAAPDAVPSNSAKGLSSEDFVKREKAYNELKIWAEKNLNKSPEALHAYWQKQSDPEVIARANALMRSAFDLRVEKRGSGFVGVSLGMALRRPLGGALGLGEKRGGLIQGVKIAAVSPGLAGEKAGLEEGDIVTRLNGKEFSGLIDEYSIEGGVNLSEIDAFIYYIMLQKPGDVVTLKIIRGEDEISKKVTLIARPEVPAPHPGHLKAVRQILFDQWFHKLAK